MRVFALALVPLAGCILVDTGKDCDASAAGSVAVSVSASDGGDVSEAEVSWTSDGDTFQPCDPFPGDGEWVCGWEAAGNLGIRVVAGGYQVVEETVFVEQGECHVIPQHLEVVLAPEDVDCTDIELPSVIATVESTGGEALEGVTVRWTRVAEPELAPCDAREDGRWACGYEVPGALRVVAEAEGHAAQTMDVDVGLDADACHVVTEALTFRLERSAE